MGGQRARFLTTFDATVYYMIYSMAGGLPTPPSFRCEKLSKEGMHISEKDELAMRFVRGILVAIGEKMRDDRLDGDKLKANILKLMVGKIIKKAQDAEPELARVTYDGIERINRLQESEVAVLDLLSAYGETMADSLRCIGEVPQEYEELQKAIAAWTFYVDILCDYDEDYKANKFNPLKRAEYPTLKTLFNKEYAMLFELNRTICGRVVAALNATKNQSTEWYAVRGILTHAMTNVVPDILDGKDVKFKYFRELTKNMRAMKKSRKRFDEAEAYAHGAQATKDIGEDKGERD